MTVYWEYVFAENFLLDLLLLLLSLACARQKPRVLNVTVAALVGGAEAVAFPLLALPTWCVYSIKILGGILIAVLAVHKGSVKTYLVTVCAFFFFTFALGGVLVAAYSFLDVDYAAGQGFWVERAPVALVLSLAGLFALFTGYALKFIFRRVRERNCRYDCTLTQNGRTVCWKGFADSGNLLTFRGKPVCVVSAVAVFALFGAHPKEEGRMTVNTVNGTSEAPVFACDSLVICGERGEYETGRVFLTTGDVRSKEFQILLHTALTEEYHEHFYGVEEMVGNASGRRRGGKLSLRKRGASVAALGRRGGGNAPKARRGGGDGGGKGKTDRA